MHLVYLTTHEENILERYIKSSPLETVRLRAHAVAMRARRLGLEDIAKLVYRSVQTVSRWIAEFVKKRLASIFSDNVGNENAAKLTREQKKEVRVGLHPQIQSP